MYRKASTGAPATSDVSLGEPTRHSSRETEAATGLTERTNNQTSSGPHLHLQHDLFGEASLR